jgi:predicted dehydrogenase
VKSLLHENIPFLLEKPPASDLESTLEMARLIKEKGFRKYDIAFNLRYHPVLQFLKDFISKIGKIYSAHIYAGYYLPYWRPGTDYRESASATKNLGGGVHLELAHEIEYSLWLFGIPRFITGYVNKISSLEISTNDICSAILEYPNGAIAEIHLDYLSQKYLRGGRIIADMGTLEWEWNAQAGKVLYYGLKKGTSEEIFVLHPGYDFNSTYKEEIENFTGIIRGTKKSIVTIDTALNTMKVIGAIERAAQEKTWVTLNEL